MFRLVFRNRLYPSLGNAIAIPISYITKSRDIHLMLNKRQINNALKKINANNWDDVMMYARDKYHSLEVMLVEHDKNKRIWKLKNWNKLTSNITKLYIGDGYSYLVSNTRVDYYEIYYVSPTGETLEHHTGNTLPMLINEVIKLHPEHAAILMEVSNGSI